MRSIARPYGKADFINMLAIAPVIFVFFNRPEVTRRTFAAIQQQRPKRLYLIADGPRADRPGEAARCDETRRVVEEMLDWPCEVTRNYSPVNLGCGKRLSSGLTAAFSELGEAIVLEDDILPRPEFFQYCTKLLHEFRDASHVHAINGFNPLGSYDRGRQAYVPTVFNSIWGWASWARSWKDYRFEFADWSSDETKLRIREYVSSDLTYQFFANSFDQMLRGNLDTWDFQWTFAMLERRRVALVSSVNLVQNIGFSADATHTTTAEPYFQALRTYRPKGERAPRSTLSADRLHDALYAKIIMSSSIGKIALTRFLAKFPATAKMLGYVRA